ncbi:MAG TPA: hypothetical protein VF153_05245 [Candidatus Limnocylindria bacterium]
MTEAAYAPSPGVRPPRNGALIVNLDVAPDGPRLAVLAALAAQDRLRIRIGQQLPLERASRALAAATCGRGGGAVALLIAAEVSR